MFVLTDEPIDTSDITHHEHTGGVVVFDGRVRTINDGKVVTSLEYEAYPALAQHEGDRIVAEALKQFDILDAKAIHRTGHLAIGDIAVWVMSAAVHRKQAFEATEYMINTIKERVPIWKKEHYQNGDAIWVRCDHCHVGADHMHL